jgi:hypothetical protein
MIDKPVDLVGSFRSVDTSETDAKVSIYSREKEFLQFSSDETLLIASTLLIFTPETMQGIPGTILRAR